MILILACGSPPETEAPLCEEETPDPVEEVGEVGDDESDPGDEEARADFFDPFAVQPIFLTVGELEQDALRGDPHSYVRATFSHGTTELAEVGLRLKGSSSFLPWDEKPSLKIRLNAFVEDQRYLGLERITLNNMVQDEAQASEVFSYHLLQGGEQLAPRAGFAEVFVRTGPDESWERFGLYANVESVDERLLMHRGFVPGNLWEADEDCDFTQSMVDNFLDGWGDGDPAKLQAVADALDADERLSVVDGLVDDEQFLAFWAWSIGLANSDVYPYSHNDFYVHERDEDGRLVFLPWGLDETWNRGSQVYEDLEGRLGEVCVAEEACLERFEREVEAVLESYWAQEPLALLEELFALTESYVEDDPRRPYDLDTVWDEREELENDADGWAGELEEQMGL